MLNNLLPARLGELARAFVLADRERLGKGQVLGTLVFDRFLDGVSLLVMLVTVLLTLRLPPGMEEVRERLTAAGLSAAGVAAAMVLFLVVVARRREVALGVVERLCRALPERFRERVLSATESFLHGLIPAGERPSPVPLVVTSVVIWATAAWPVDLVLRSFGAALPPSGTLFILVLLIFAVMVPASPGYIGTYHAACVYGLLAFGLSREKALSIAIVLHGLNFLPVTLVGFLLLARQRLSLGELEHRVQENGS
jgi:uncharacterized protein (TIRG00374 family)